MEPFVDLLAKIDEAERAGPFAPDVMVQRFSVPFEYPVVFTRDVWAPHNPALADVLSRLEPGKRHRFFAVVDDGVERAWPTLLQDIAAYARAHPARLELLGEPLVVAGGEQCKNDKALLGRVQERFLDLGLDRHSFVVIVGGGAVLDMAGYAAAITHRGLRVVRVPTTVLAQNDSGVGVKNGVNAFGEQEPVRAPSSRPSPCSTTTGSSSTLGPRDRAEGMAEAVKVALIRDAEFFSWLEANAGPLRAFEEAAVGALIRRCAELHLRHIATSGDPFETGSARPLDFGHWAAHGSKP